MFEDNYDERIATIRTDTKRLEEMKSTFDKSINVSQVLYKIRAKVYIQCVCVANDYSNRATATLLLKL